MTGQSAGAGFRLPGAVFGERLPRQGGELVRRPGDGAVEIVFAGQFGEQPGSQNLLFRLRELGGLSKGLLK